MKLIFKPTIPVIAPTLPKVGDTNFKEHYGEVNRNMLFVEIELYIRQATELYIIPFIGRPIYDDIAAKFHANATLSDEQKFFLQLLQDTVAYYTMRHAYPKKRSVMASMGIVENSPKDGSNPASAIAYKQTLWDLTLNADKFLDNVIFYMQEQVAAGVADFDLWKDDPSYTKNVHPLFRTTDVFQKYYNIHNSRRTLQVFYPSIRVVERKYLKPILCDEMLAELYEQIEKNTLSTKNKILLEYVREVAAFATIYEGVELNNVVLEADGVRALSSDDGSDKRSSVLQAFKDSIAAIKWKCDENMRMFSQDLIVFLNKNADDYPSWKASDCNKNISNSDCGCKDASFACSCNTQSMNGRGGVFL